MLAGFASLCGKKLIVREASRKLLHFSNINFHAIKARNFSMGLSGRKGTVLGSSVLSLVLCGSGTAVFCASAEQVKKDEVAKEAEIGMKH